MKLRAIGYWRNQRDETPTLPDPRDFLDPDWDADVRSMMVSYLRAGRRVRGYMGKSRCRLCGQTVGCMEISDGTYLWPEGFAHYVEQHSLRPPDQFVAHMLAQLEWQDAIERDVEWWSTQSCTGSARGWRQWRIDLEVGANADALVAPNADADAVLRDLRERGVAYLSDSESDSSIRRDLESSGLSLVFTKEVVSVPELLLA